MVFDCCFKKDLYATRRPNGDASPEEIRVLCPYIARQSQCCGQHRPVVLITTAQAQPSFGFENPISFRRNRLNNLLQVSKGSGEIGRLASLSQKRRQIFLDVFESHIRREKPDTLSRVGVQKLPNPMSQDGANENVRVENDHLNGMSAFRVDVTL